MKRTLLFTLLLILGISICGNVYAQINVTVGDGTTTNTTSGVPAPYGTWYKSFRQQFLILASELEDLGGGAGNINSLAFNVDNLNNCSPMPNFTIRIKTTSQTVLTTTFEDGDYQTVFMQDGFMPTTGWNVHEFTTPFNWDGASNILVDIATSLFQSSYTQNASVFYTATGFNSSLRFQSDSAEGHTAATGTVSMNRSNIRFNMEALVVTDPPNPPIMGSPANGAQNILGDVVLRWSSGGGAPLGYKVHFGTTNPPPFVEQTTETMYDPTVENENTYYWQIVPFNAIGDAQNCPIWSFTTAGQHTVIGAGDQLARMPMDFYYKGSLFETIYYADELGFASGTISAIAFFNSFTSSTTMDKPTQIWLGSTNQTDLVGAWIPSTEMNLVFDGNVDYPAGENTVTIQLQSPYMHTPGNLVMMVKRPLDGSYFSTSDNFKCQTGTEMRTRKLQSDTIEYDTTAPPTATAVAQFPKTVFFYSGQQIENDLGAIAISGNQTPSAGITTDYDITIKNNGINTQTNYQVKLFTAGDVEVASVNGPTIESMEILQVAIPWTPTQTGPTYLYGKVVLANDEIPQNNQTANYPVDVQASGATVISIGTGTATNTTTGVPTPYGTYYKNFRQQYLWTADEMFAAGAAPGLITAIGFNVQSPNNCSPMPNYTIKMKPTNQSVLTTTFEVGDYTEVWYLNDFVPVAGWNMHTLTQPFFWDGVSNILVNIHSTVIPGSYTQNASVYYTPTTGVNTSLRYQSDSTDAGTYATGTLSANRANVRFSMVIEDMATLNGTVTSEGSPVADVHININDSIFHTTTNSQGQYNFPYVQPGTYTVTATKLGFESMTLPVTLVANETTNLDFNLTASESVNVTGFVVGSDQPTVGLEEAEIVLTGIMNYSGVTDATGHFSIPGVLSGNTYGYRISKEGYQELTGSIDVGQSNFDMGTLTLSEIAFPPSQVVATENVDQTQVSLIWNSPTAAPPFDDFENNDGGWIPTASWDPVGDWEWTNEYDVANFVDSYGSTSVIPPPACYSGTGMWGTKINTNYTNSGGSNYLSKTFNLAGINNPELRFWSWENVFGNYDYCQVNVNGTLVWGPSWDYTNTQWRERVINLSAYAGQSDVEITLEMFATTVVNYAGWYIDDVYVGPALDRAVASAPAIAPVWMSGLSELEAAAAVDRMPPLATREKTTSSEPQRIHVGYKVWRLLQGNETDEATWTPLTTATITDSTFVDNAWQPLPSGIYRYAVKAEYTNNVLSDPAFSNEIHKGMMGTLTGNVTEFGTNVPVGGATITAGDYSGTSDASGNYAFLVYQGTYDVTCSRAGYQSSTAAGIQIIGTQTTTQDFVLTEITLPPADVVATEASPDLVNITWNAPGEGGGEWIYYTDVDSNNAIGLTSGGSFTVAIRFPASDMQEYAGQSLYAVKVWPNESATFTLKVWTGGSASAPGTQALSQPFTPATLDVYNTLILDTPVPISGSEELWFGYAVTHTEGTYPAGVDPGPAVNGFGNMIETGGTWDTLYNLSSSLNYNWCIQGYVGYSAPTAAVAITPIAIKGIGNPVSYGEFSLSTDSPLPASRSYTKSLRPEASETPKYNRVLNGYRVWRLLQGQENNESAWTQLTTQTITATALQDDQWNTVPYGTYRWAVKAYYTGDAASVPTFSNPLAKITQIGTIAGIVRNQQNAPIMGATITCGDASATTNASGAYSMQVIAGTHSVTASAAGYAPATQTGVVVVTGQTTTVNFQLAPSHEILVDGFETYTDFATTFAPWTTVDVDQSGTYGISGYSWPGIYDPVAYLIFNPNTTTPPLTTVEAHGGQKMAAAMAATTPPNNDWLITPVLERPIEISFWAKSHTAQYGLERFKVGVSTTGTNPANFTIISGTNYIQTPDVWTEYTYSLANYATSETVYVGIECVSNDAFIFFIDDVTVTGGDDANDPGMPVVATALHGNYPNPFNPETTITYSVKDAGPISIEIYNAKGQLVKTLVNEHKASGNYSIVWNGRDNNNQAVSSGIYFYKMQAGKYSSTKKMVLMK